MRCFKLILDPHMESQSVLFGVFKGLRIAQFQIFSGLIIYPITTVYIFHLVRAVGRENIFWHKGLREVDTLAATEAEVHVLICRHKLYCINDLHRRNLIGELYSGNCAVCGKTYYAILFCILRALLHVQARREFVAFLGGQFDHMDIGVAREEGGGVAAIFCVNTPVRITAPCTRIPLLTGNGAVIVNHIAAIRLFSAVLGQAVIHHGHLVDVGILKFTGNCKGIAHGDGFIVIPPVDDLIGEHRGIGAGESNDGILRKHIAVTGGILIVGIVSVACLELISEVIVMVDGRGNFHTV